METEPKEYRESHLRSLLKAMSWRVVATLTTTIIAYFITGEVETALAIGSIEFVLKFLIYYMHERAWQLIPRGGIRAFGKRILRLAGIQLG
jgi:uncharacterized membrane protein